jgi:uncharacterized protein YaeQ
MALKATISKARVELADMDRQVYGEYSLTLARHPSETDERMMIRLLAFALNVPENNDRGDLELARDMWEPDEPGLWQRDFTGQLVHWIEVGTPDEKRLSRVCARSERVSVYAFQSSAAVWWAGISPRLSRLQNLTVWRIPEAQSAELAALAQRTMELHVSIQDGTLWVTEGQRSVQIDLACLLASPADPNGGR